MNIKKAAASILAAAIAAASPFSPLPARAQEVAVVDVVRVVDASVPGKAGQRYIDGLKKELDAELENFKKSLGEIKEDDPRLARKQAQLSARYQSEFSRVTGLLTAELRRVTSEWLNGNKQGATVVIPAGTTLAAAPESDVNAEILRRLNTVAIDFSLKETGKGDRVK